MEQVIVAKQIALVIICAYKRIKKYSIYNKMSSLPTLTNILESSVAWYILKSACTDLTKPVDSNYRTLTFNRNPLETSSSSTGTDTWDMNDTIFDNFHSMCSNTNDSAQRICGLQRNLITWPTNAKAASYNCADSAIKIVFYWE